MAQEGRLASLGAAQVGEGLTIVAVAVVAQVAAGCTQLDKHRFMLGQALVRRLGRACAALAPHWQP